MLLCDSGVDVSSSLLLASAILMAVREQLFHSSRCLNFRNRLTIAVFAPPEMAQGYAPELEDQMKPARAMVERFAQRLDRAGFKAHTAVEIGDVRVSILRTAAEWHADLITVGSHGQRGIESFLLGRVADSIARHAKCSVRSEE